MSSQDHTYLCKALDARLNQAVAQIQIEENSSSIDNTLKGQSETKSRENGQTFL